MIHEGIELIVTFPNHECLIIFLKNLYDVSMSMAPKSFTDKNDLVRRIMINEQMKINGHPVMPLLVRNMNNSVQKTTPSLMMLYAFLRMLSCAF